MPRVPRSMSRVMPPVWRSRWKRSDRLCRWRNTPSATRRIARCATARRRRRAARRTAWWRSAGSRRSPAARTAPPRSRRAVSRPSTISFITSGTATLASLATTRKASATHHAPLVLPQVGEQLSDRAPLVAAQPLRRRGGMSSHGPIISACAADPRQGPLTRRDRARYHSNVRLNTDRIADAPARSQAAARNPHPHPGCRRRAVHAARLRSHLDAPAHLEGGGESRRGELPLRLQGRADRGGIPPPARPDERRRASPSSTGWKRKPADAPLAPEAIIRAFVGPSLRLDRGRAGRRAQLHPPAWAAPTPSPPSRSAPSSASFTRPTVARFKAAFERALPTMPRDELVWRMHFMFGTLVLHPRRHRCRAAHRRLQARGPLRRPAARGAAHLVPRLRALPPRFMPAPT